MVRLRTEQNGSGSIKKWAAAAAGELKLNLKTAKARGLIVPNPRRGVPTR
jgi:hypothetical protein